MKTPKMRTRAEIESALRHSRNREAAEESTAKSAQYDSGEYRRAVSLATMWGGYVAALEYVLRLDRGEAISAHEPPDAPASPAQDPHLSVPPHE